MLVGVAVGWELARELGNDQRTRRRLNGHPFSRPRLLRADRRRHPRARGPLPDRQPEGRRRGLRARARRTSSSRTATRTTTATSSTSPSAPARRSSRSRRWPASSASRGSRTWPIPNIGGTIEFDGGWVRLTPAWHTRTTPNGTGHTPAGLVINLGGKTVYHVGDTALFSDLRLAGQARATRARSMCIGGHYTMDRHDAASRREWIGAPVVIPCHYDTFPPIETDAQAFKADVEERTEARRPSRCSSRAGRSAFERRPGRRARTRPAGPSSRARRGRHRGPPARCPWHRGEPAGRRSRHAAASGRYPRRRLPCVHGVRIV